MDEQVVLTAKNENDPDTTARDIAFTQNITGPDGEALTSVEALVERLNQRKTFDRWAVVVHDKDNAPHVQGCASFTRAEKLGDVARWLDLPLGLVKKRSAYDVDPEAGNLKDRAFMEALLYLTHEGVDPSHGKHVYAREEVIAKPGWDWQRELDEYKRLRAAPKTNRRGNNFVEQVRRKGLSVDAALMQGARNENALRSARHDYLRHHGQRLQPLTRRNIRVSGDDAVQAHLLAVAIAEDCAERLNSRVYEVTSPKNFDDYDGEAVLLLSLDRLLEIHDDKDAMRVMRQLVMAHPLDATSPTKRYGATRLVHESVIAYGTSVMTKMALARGAGFSVSEELGATMTTTPPPNVSLLRLTRPETDEAFPILAQIVENFIEVCVSDYYLSGDESTVGKYQRASRVVDGQREVVRQAFVLDKAELLAREKPDSDPAELKRLKSKQIAPILRASEYAHTERMKRELPADKTVSFSDLLAKLNE